METKVIEIWKNVVGYEGLYEVSNLGRIRNPRTSIMKGAFYKGYLKTLLYTEDKPRKKRKMLHIHRLVAFAWIPNPENKPFINHINGLKHDNRIENLEWCTQKENIHHAYRIGLRAGLENHPTAKLTNRQVLSIRKSKQKSIDLAIKYEVNPVTISYIRTGKSWKNLF